VTSSYRDRTPPSEAVAGLLATIAIFVGALELVYRPFRLAPAALILVLIATVMSREQLGDPGRLRDDRDLLHHRRGRCRSSRTTDSTSAGYAKDKRASPGNTG